MSKVYKIGTHTFTQRNDGLYMCDAPFTMTDDECQDWMLEDRNDGYHLVLSEHGDVYTPLAVYMPAETKREAYDSYTDSICETCKCCIMIANKIPDNFMGGFLNGI